MIPLLGAKFGLLYPQLLAGVPILVGALVYAYLRRGRTRRVAVASVMFLRTLTRRTPSRRKFIPPARFFFELLLLLLLFAGAAGLYREDATRKVAVVIDNSFSM